MKNDKQIWDVVIIGGGPAGCSAALVLARVKRRVLLIDEGKQRNISSKGMHNYLTRDGISPADYLATAREELAHYNIPHINARVNEVTILTSKGFSVKTTDGETYICRRLLLATGVTDDIPDVPGMKELWGRSVFHCPYCDGWECKDETLGLYAGKLNGYGMAVALNHLNKNITLFTDGARYLRPKQKAHLEALKIKVITDKLKELVYDGDKLQAIALQNGEEVPCTALFVNHSHHVNNNLLEQLHCRCTKKGAALTNRQQQTSVPGVYVAGDASYDMHFVVVAAAEGVKAAVAIHGDLLKADDNLYK